MTRHEQLEVAMIQLFFDNALHPRGSTGTSRAPLRQPPGGARPDARVPPVDSEDEPLVPNLGKA
jgi:hypothetical protein